ncbi:FAD-dependent oxidoreductase [Paenibacillus validus]|uniref:FAD-dependent oxidoreductase n=1 Tax=Paenibacillus validus TaxID=44253 RepID=A0A7X2ZBX1_9BACL|nr:MULTISPECIES: FAD-dependent oxidoreductase [Paenibacillus]MED4599445.1 FAD-dependent oxidoreductase [Paenibacillus validus]MED4605157.1 FAD-dependent oxidoreductase [Paenibacillus validus]MUG71989.1 FAD-dependent oxidoreductase [Paenibacillus validus]
MQTIETDIVVVGGGPAGINAAIAAGRSGARTLLIERYGFLGGMSTIALVYPWMTYHTMDGKQVIAGIAQEIIDRLMALNASPGHVRDTCGFVSTITPYDPEIYKVLVLDMLREAGVKLLLHSFVDDVTVKDERIESVRLTSKSGKIDVKAKMFIDTSGDADVAYLAGAPILKGRDEDQLTQPMTMKFRMRGVDLARVKQYMIEHPEEFYKKTPIDELDQLPLTAVQGFYKHWKEAALPINRDQVLFFTGPGEDEVLVNTTRVQGLDGTRVEDLTEAEELGRKQVLMVADFMVKHLPGFEKASISQVGAQIGIRETRRLDGVYSLQISDVTEGRRFEDCIARSGYPIDIHDPKNKGVTAAWIAGDGAYDIPYRSLLAKGVSNLLAGGRCISTSHEALATTRLSPSCMATGQAAGTAAGMAVKQGVSPHELNVKDLQQQLRQDGVLLD